MKRYFLFFVLGMGILLLGLFLYLFFIKQEVITESPSSPDNKMTETLIVPPSSLGDMAVGSADAPVTLIEYFSLTCPHCAAFHKNVYPQIKSAYIDTGKVRMIFRDFPLDNISLVASLLLRCVPEDSYERVLKTLFEQQKKWLSGGNAKKALQSLSLFFGMSEGDYRSCLARQDLLNGLDEQRKLAIDAGVNSTPTFFIKKRKMTGNQSYKKMKAFIDQSLKDVHGPDGEKTQIHHKKLQGTTS